MTTVVDPSADDLRWLMTLGREELSDLLAAMEPLRRVALVEAIERLAPPPKPWEPLPHQVPPDPDETWSGWLALAGRGSGKTSGVTHWLNDHANGPACLDGPIPHRMGIIAPTLGDASASIVHGDDGLKVINPEVREVTRKGGTVVLWPNGAEAMLFGVYTRSDVERLRAKTNRCLSAGTLVATERGPVPIEKVTTSDRVWTRNGLRRVLAAGPTGVKECIVLTAEDGRQIRLTPDHLINAGQEWKQAGLASRVWVCHDLSSNTTDGVTTNARTATTGTTKVASCIGPSTPITTVRFPQGRTSITSTTTRKTTTRRTSRSLRRKSTGMSMVTTDQLIGTRSVVGKCGPPVRSSRWNAQFAGRRLTNGRYNQRFIAPNPVPESGSTINPEPRQLARSAAPCSSPSSTPRLALAPLTVVQSSPTGLVEPVFDLTVETDHEFFANGVLVHNCADLREEIAAWRYLRDGMDQADFGLRKGTHRWVGATTPKPRPTIRKLVKDPRVVLITATTDDNPHLAADKREELYEKFGNTRLGKQELEAKILEDQAGALWTQELIEQYRVTEADVPRLIRVRTYVDPSWGTTHDECGIVVCGLGVNRHLYVLADLSKRTTPSEWGMLAAIGRIPPQRKDGSWVLEPDWEPRDYCGKVSECVVAEKNFQGEQVRLVMKLTSRDIGQRIRFGWVNSSQGKRLRAEPVVQLFERGKVHMVGSHEHLEWQLTNWVPPEASDGETDQGDPVEHEGGAEDGQDPSKWSPDRLDAMVFGCSDLLIGPNSGTGKLEIADGRVPRPSLERSAGPQSKGPQIGAIPMSTRQGRIIREQQAERRPAE